MSLFITFTLLATMAILNLVLDLYLFAMRILLYPFRRSLINRSPVLTQSFIGLNTFNPQFSVFWAYVVVFVTYIPRYFDDIIAENSKMKLNPELPFTKSLLRPKRKFTQRDILAFFMPIHNPVDPQTFQFRHNEYFPIGKPSSVVGYDDYLNTFLPGSQIETSVDDLLADPFYFDRVMDHGLNVYQLSSQELERRILNENAVYVWIWLPYTEISSTGNIEHASVGHVAIQTKSNYFSFWPEWTEEDTLHHRFKGASRFVLPSKPSEDEYGKSPQYVIELTGLDIKNIDSHIQQLKAELEDEKMAWGVNGVFLNIGGDKLPIAGFKNTKTNQRILNCSASAYEILLAGGLDRLVNLPQFYRYFRQSMSLDPNTIGGAYGESGRTDTATASSNTSFFHKLISFFSSKLQKVLRPLLILLELTPAALVIRVSRAITMCHCMLEHIRTYYPKWYYIYLRSWSNAAGLKNTNNGPSPLTAITNMHATALYWRQQCTLLQAEIDKGFLKVDDWSRIAGTLLGFSPLITPYTLAHIVCLARAINRWPEQKQESEDYVNRMVPLRDNDDVEESKAISEPFIDREKQRLKDWYQITRDMEYEELEYDWPEACVY